MRPIRVTAVIASAAAVACLGLMGPPENDEQAVREVLSKYLAAVAWPSPQPIDSEIFAEDILAFWSGGQTYNGRAEVVKAMENGIAELKADFTAFGVRAENIQVRGSKDMIWMTCQLEARGTLTEERGEFQRTVRSSFVFEMRGDKWQMTHEHSSRPPKQSE